jgi:hypothetical protein
LRREKTAHYQPATKEKTMSNDFGMKSWPRLNAPKEVSVFAIFMRNLRRFMDEVCQ